MISVPVVFYLSYDFCSSIVIFEKYNNTGTEIITQIEHYWNRNHNSNITILEQKS
jgi:hypothetical protein